MHEQIPAAVSRFPRDNPLPRSWAERAYPKLIYYNELDRGGHFAAWNNRNSLPARCERHSGRCADRCTLASVRSRPASRPRLYHCHAKLRHSRIGAGPGVSGRALRSIAPSRSHPRLWPGVGPPVRLGRGLRVHSGPCNARGLPAQRRRRRCGARPRPHGSAGHRGGPTGRRARAAARALRPRAVVAMPAR
jgi:hypothetical protein